MQPLTDSHFSSLSFSLLLFARVSVCAPFVQRRYQQDVVTNSTPVSVWRFDAWLDVAWADVRAGDIVRVVCDAYFPADLVLLQSSSNQGACSIETANLDGQEIRTDTADWMDGRPARHNNVVTAQSRRQRRAIGSWLIFRAAPVALLHNIIIFPFGPSPSQARRISR